MAKKTSKKTEEQVINEVEITETVQETVKEEKQLEPEVQEVVDTIMEEIKENTPERTEPEEFLEKEISMGEEITEIQEEFKDTSARLEELVNNNKDNLKEALESELKEVLKAEEIVENFSHDRPDGQSCFTILDELGIECSYMAENIAYGYDSPEKTMEHWINSPPHYENIMNPDFTEVGIGYYYDESISGEYFWTQMFIKK